MQDFLDAHPGDTPDGWSSRQLPPLPPHEAFSDSDAAGESAMDDDSSSSEEEDDEDDADEEVEESDESESSDSEMAVADAPAEEEEESSEEEDDDSSESEMPVRLSRITRFENFPIELVDKARRAMELALELHGSYYTYFSFRTYLDGQHDGQALTMREKYLLFNGLLASMEPAEGMPPPESEEEDEHDDDYDDSDSALSD